MERERRKQILEALILASPEPISAARLADIVPHLKPRGVKELVAELREDHAREGRGFEIWEVAGGYQLRTLPELAHYVRQLHKERPVRLSRAAVETLSVIAYKQPVTRAEIEHVRGVDVGAVIRSLVERDLVRVAGHRDVPGRPMLYGTTRRFLEVFGLERLEDLPTLREIDELLPPEAAGGAGEDEPVAEAAGGGGPADGSGPDDPPGAPRSGAPGGDAAPGAPVGAGELH